MAPQIRYPLSAATHTAGFPREERRAEMRAPTSTSRELAEANGASLEMRDNPGGAHFCLTGRRQP